MTTVSCGSSRRRSDPRGGPGSRPPSTFNPPGRRLRGRAPSRRGPQEIPDVGRTFEKTRIKRAPELFCSGLAFLDRPPMQAFWIVLSTFMTVASYALIKGLPEHWAFYEIFFFRMLLMAAAAFAAARLTGIALKSAHPGPPCAAHGGGHCGALPQHHCGAQSPACGRGRARVHVASICRGLDLRGGFAQGRPRRQGVSRRRGGRVCRRRARHESQHRRRLARPCGDGARLLTLRRDGLHVPQAPRPRARAPSSAPSSGSPPEARWRPSCRRRSSVRTAFWTTSSSPASGPSAYARSRASSRSRAQNLANLVP